LVAGHTYPLIQWDSLHFPAVKRPERLDEHLSGGTEDTDEDPGQ